MELIPPKKPTAPMRCLGIAAVIQVAIVVSRLAWDRTFVWQYALLAAVLAACAWWARTVAIAGAFVALVAFAAFVALQAFSGQFMLGVGIKAITFVLIALALRSAVKYEAALARADLPSSV